MSAIQPPSKQGPAPSTLQRLDPSADEYKRTHKAILDSLHQRCTRQEQNIVALTEAVRALGGKV